MKIAFFPRNRRDLYKPKRTGKSFRPISPIASFVVLSFLLLVHPSFVEAQDVGEADFYVATNGSDNNPGTKNKPFATLSRARDAVRQLKKQGLKKDIAVLVRGGGYTLYEPVVFSLKDSGTDGHSITYAAYPGEHPVPNGFAGESLVRNRHSLAGNVVQLLPWF